MSITTPAADPTASTFARLSTWQARCVLAAFALLLGIGLWKGPTPPELCDVRQEEKDTNSDVYLYMTEVQRIHAGENYYQVAAEELTKLGYPTASVFNWRTPLPMWLIGKMPDPLAARLLLIAAGIAMLLMSFEAAAREQPNIYRLAMPMTLLLTAPMLPCFQGSVFVLSEVWSGIFIAVSLAAYGVNLRFLGATMGLAALFFRELALPYCAIGLTMALWERRPKESAVWIAGLAGWAVYYGLHCWKVSHLITAAATAHRRRLVPLRRADVRDRDRADELVPGAVARLDYGGLLRAGDCRFCRLADRMGAADRAGRGSLYRGLFHRGSGVQPLLGAIDYAAVLLWRGARAAGAGRSLPGGETAVAMAWKFRMRGGCKVTATFLSVGRNMPRLSGSWSYRTGMLTSP